MLTTLIVIEFSVSLSVKEVIRLFVSFCFISSGVWLKKYFPHFGFTIQLLSGIMPI